MDRLRPRRQSTASDARRDPTRAAHPNSHLEIPMSVLRPLLLVAAVSVAACAPDRLASVDDTAARSAALTPRTGGPSANDAVVDDDPHFVAAAAGAPTIANPLVTFWAVKGRDTTVQMYYHSTTSGRDSTPFFSIRVRARSLWKRPDGSTIADGDSVQITLTLVDAERLIVDCQPSGLRFDPKDPARARMSFEFTDSDVNDDGRVDAADTALTKTFAIWRQETTDAPWYRQLSNLSFGAHEVETDVGGFTSYAIAW